VVLLNLESKTYYSLNLTGTWIWQSLKQGLSVLELVDDLSQQKLVQVLD
jgi:hypothetical protein